MWEAARELLDHPMVVRGIWAVVSIIIAVVVIRLTQRSITKYVADADTRYRARKAASTVGWLLLILYLILLFSDSLGRIAVVLGVASAGVAFALQEVIVSIAGWIAISFGRILRVGDRVEVGNTMGDVIDIGILRTAIMECGEWVRGDNYTGRIVFVGNSSVFRGPVRNYTIDFPFLWDELNVPIHFGGDYELARSILMEAADEVVGQYTLYAQQHWRTMLRRYKVEPARVEPSVLLRVTDNWVEYTLRYVVDYKQRRVTRDAIFRLILQRVEETQGTVRLASATYEIVGLPGVEIDLTSGGKALHTK